jgi:hypothetical protein
MRPHLDALSSLTLSDDRKTKALRAIGTARQLAAPGTTGNRLSPDLQATMRPDKPLTVREGYTLK